jgi:hypothetical protein
MWQFLEVLGASGAAAAIVIFLGRTIVQQVTSKDLESFKLRLQSQAQVNLERLRAELQQAALEHSIRFSRVHERQAEVISEVFGGLERLHEAFLHWTRPANTSIEDADMFALGREAVEAFNSFRDIYYPRAIWLDRETCDAINAVLDTLGSSYWKFVAEHDERGFPRDRRRWLAVWETVSGEIPKARQLLDERFRKVLGVDLSVTR